MSYIYLIDPSGAIDGPVELPIIPGIGIQPPSNAVALDFVLDPPAAGKVWAWVDAEVRQIADSRGVVYSVETGAEQNYTVLGDLPPTLTALPWPGRHFVWTGTEWRQDEEAVAAEALAIERDWRSARIAESDFLAMPDYPITAEQRVELYGYRQALRDWPASAQPPIQQRPEPPAWFAEKIK
ncbi:phage tail assembly chaperone [Pseudomonas sp. NPDC087614]|uniref:phage tail assembly chaperone n=1 Tax=Pseudomonas sp. NPDC087614 TaxID=3364442 RepID=UPI00382EA98F